MHRTLPLALVVLCAIAFWAVFAPAIMSPDSVDQYAQAVTGRFRDWHPPIMAVILHVLLRCHGDIGALMLLQALATCLGVWFLSRRTIKRTGVPAEAQAWLSFAVLLILLSPLSPLPFAAMTFWKDYWLAVLFVWILGLSDWAREHIGNRTCRAPMPWILLIGVLGALALCVRHNTLVVAPVLCLLLWLVARQRYGRTLAAGLSLLPAVLYLLLEAGMYQGLNVERRYPGNQIRALELVGLIVAEPSLQAEFPYTASQLRDDYRDRYQVGNVGPLYFETTLIVDPRYVRMGKNRALEAEYKHALQCHPFRLAALKVEAWWKLLVPYHTRYWCFARIIDNPYGLKPNTLFHRFRERLVRGVEGVFAVPWVQWLTGSHLIWLLANTLWLVCWAVFGARRGAPSRLFDLSALALPLAYYLSFLFAVPNLAERFMYPATLIMQIITLSALLGLLTRRCWSRRQAPQADAVPP